MRPALLARVGQLLAHFVAAESPFGALAWISLSERYRRAGRVGPSALGRWIRQSFRQLGPEQFAVLGDLEPVAPLLVAAHLSRQPKPGTA